MSIKDSELCPDTNIGYWDDEYYYYEQGEARHYYFCEKLGCAYMLENDKLVYTPLNKDGSFDVNDWTLVNDSEDEYTRNIQQIAYQELSSY